MLVVERFDRRLAKDGRLIRLPQEDCCQALGIPPTLKYQNDGGPGIVKVLDLLKASDTPDADRRAFLKTQMLFWLMAATDGHAKNYSVFLLPGGRFRMSPLYDVISVQPSIDARQLQRQKVKLAMSVGAKRHYQIDEIVPRHFDQTAAQSGLGAEIAGQLFTEIAERFDGAWETVLRDLPEQFPEELIASIRNGMTARLRLLQLG